ncbi:hypothetical protein PMZ80_005252 [Knufia obscura]|uniref:BTB domain-containing protein n=1 Tax=Knufia obscura TaxID=1635080 RepID=A0ABR0RQ10_9EURO|nr:hypothetical protein PMZ80_005252 [Knufia obscura]
MSTSPLQPAKDNAQVGPSSSPSTFIGTVPITARSWTQSEIVTIYVGPKRKAFRAHKDLLTAKSAYFKKCLEDNKWAEGASKEIHWDGEDDTVEAVEMMIDWLYGEDLTLDHAPWPVSRHVVDCYKLADKRLMYGFKNALVDALRQRLNRDDNPRYVTIDSLEHAYTCHLETSPLYKCMLESVVWGVSIRESIYRLGGPWEWRLSKALENHGIARDLTQEFAFGPRKNPATARGCCYHDHSDGPCCGLNNLEDDSDDPSDNDVRSSSASGNSSDTDA